MEDDHLASAIASVYGGPLEEFVHRRDALAKELRAARERDAATAVKALRKPSRVAWALNLASPDMAPLEAAVAATLGAQAGGGDVRAAIGSLRAAVRALAARAAEASERGGHAVGASVLASALLAVLGRPDSFAQLRAGCLADVPEAGGLDVLAALPEPTPAPVVAPKSASPAPPAAPAPGPAERAAAARAEVRRATAVVAETRERAVAAGRALQQAESKLHVAEAKLREAEAERAAALVLCERAREDAEAAAARVEVAERALAEVQQQVAE